jgi:amino acid permease
MKKDMASLLWAGYVGFIILLLLCAVVLAYFVRTETSTGVPEGICVARADLNLLFALSTFVLSYGAHLVTQPVYEEMQDRTPRRFYGSITFAMIVVLCLYVWVGMFGYFTYGPETPGNILLALPKQDDGLAGFMRIAYALKLILVIPLGLNSLRITTHLLFFRKPTHSDRSHVIITLVWLILPLAIAIPLSDIANLMALVGAVCGSHMVFIAPAAYYLKLAPKRTWSLWLIMMSLIIFGYCVLVLGVIAVAAAATGLTGSDLSCAAMNMTNSTAGNMTMSNVTRAFESFVLSEFN